ncbi:hypothetical protein ABBQ32_004786 [Trebouxia sp. C0010 RCD-2024]
MSANTASLTCVSVRCTNSFKPARPSRSVQRLTRVNIIAESRQEAGSKKAFMSGLAALASVPLLFGGPAVAFVGNTASDFADKVDQVTPDVPLPGLKQKGKEADAIGAAPNKSGPGAADQVKGAASDVADKAADVGGGALENVKPKRGFFERINDEALTKNSPSVQQKR